MGTTTLGRRGGWWMVAAACLLMPQIVSADVKLPSLFSQHMVLQRDVPLPLWGWASPGEAVTVKLDSQTVTATADAAGKWQVSLAKLPAGGPHTLQVEGQNKLTIADVLVGEVWLASGQSNMAMTVSRSNHFEQERPAATFPQIRMFTVGRAAKETPQAECTGTWKLCSPETVGAFSATGYFFARELHKKLGVPVGIINSSVGGTPIESWTSYPAQQAVSELEPLLTSWKKNDTNYDEAKALAKYEVDLAKFKTTAAAAKAAGKPAPRAPEKPVQPRTHRNYPGALYNGMIEPLAPFAVRGVIWYQGESNAGGDGASRYQYQLPALVADWRKRWGNETLPFAWVQLPNMDRGGKEGWSLVREAMLNSLRIPHTGMAITIDIGDAKDVHPTNKQDVGLRLAYWALATVYAQPNTVASGPLPAGQAAKDGKLVLSFKYADGLQAKEGDLKGFEVAGADGKWLPAQAQIEGPTVVVSHPDVAAPTAARYSWSDNPDGNLINGAGLPASPFRTTVSAK